MAGSSTDGAFERSVSRSAASERPCRVPCMVTTVISYNFGIEQQMLHSATWSPHIKAQFLELLHSFVAGYDADMVLGCEVGGHAMGLSRNQMASLEPESVATKFCQNYMIALKAEVDVIEHFRRLPPLRRPDMPVSRRW